MVSLFFFSIITALLGPDQRIEMSCEMELLEGSKEWQTEAKEALLQSPLTEIFLSVAWQNNTLLRVMRTLYSV